MKHRALFASGILIALILLNLDLIAPEASALPQQTDDQWEIWNQIQVSGNNPLTEACSGQTNNVGVGLTIGQSYYFLLDVTSVPTSKNLTVGKFGGGHTLFQVDGLALISNPDMQANVQLINFVNLTGANGGWYAVVQATETATENVGVSCDTSMGYQAWNKYPGAPSCIGANGFAQSDSTAIIGLVGMFTFSPQTICGSLMPIGFILSASVNRQSETSVTANQIQFDASDTLPFNRINPDIALGQQSCSGPTIAQDTGGGITQSIGQQTQAKYWHSADMMFISNASITDHVIFAITRDQTPKNVINTNDVIEWGNYTVTTSGSGQYDLVFDFTAHTITNGATNVPSASITVNDWNGNAPNVTGATPIFLMLHSQSNLATLNNVQYRQTCTIKTGWNLTVSNAGTYNTESTLSTGFNGNGPTIYGKDSYPFQLNVTAANVATAMYAFVLDDGLATGVNGAPQFFSSTDGLSLKTTSFINPNGSIMYSLRMGFLINSTPTSQSGPWNQSGTWTARFQPSNQESRDLYYSATDNYASNHSNVAALNIANNDGYSGGTTGLITQALFSTNDFFTEIVVEPADCTVAHCASLQLFNTTPFPANVPVTLTVTGTSTFRTITQSTSINTALPCPHLNLVCVSFTGQDLGSAQILTLTYGGPQVISQSWTICLSGNGCLGSSTNGNGIWLFIGNTGAFVNTNGGGGNGSASTTVVTITDQGTCVIIPSGFNASVTVSSTSVFSSFFKQQADGSLTLASSIQQLVPIGGVATVGWHPGLGYTTTSDTGNFVLVISNSTGNILASDSFQVVTSGSCGALVSMDSYNQGVVTAQLKGNAAQIINTVAPSPAATATDAIAAATQFAWRTDFFIPNMWLLVVISLIVGTIAANVRGRM